MSAYQLHLEPWLEEARLEAVVTSQEAWAVQDEILQAQTEFVPMPEHLQPVMQRLHLYEVGMLNLTVH